MNTMDLLIQKNHYFQDNSNKSKFGDECLKRLLNDVEYLTNIVDKYEISFRHKLIPVCKTLMTIFTKSK